MAENWDNKTNSNGPVLRGENNGGGEARDETSKIIESYKNPRYRYLVLGILTTVYVSNFVDRQVINVLAQYIICLLYTSPSPRDS